MSSVDHHGQPVERETPDVNRERVDSLVQLFPECVTEGKIDLDKLRLALGEEIDDRPERYTFSWAGKRDAIRVLQAPSRATLVPSPEESIDFNNTQNLFIEGDNLEVLKLLFKPYFARVKMIYIDPPYNTGNDFVYRDNYRDPLDAYLRLTGQKAANGDVLTSNPETGGRYHSAWLSMMYPRLFLARHLLSDDGILLVSISDVEVHNLIMMLNEAFGEENQLAVFTWKSRAKPTNAGDAIYQSQRVAEHVLAYARSADSTSFLPLYSGEERTYPHTDPKGRTYRLTTILTSNRGRYRRETMRFPLGDFTPSEDQRWKAGPDIVHSLYATEHIEFRDGVPFRRHFKDEEKEEHDPLWTFLPEDWTGTAESGKAELTDLVGPHHGLDSVKPTELIRIFLQATTVSDDLVVDFFAGSCTTAHAVMALNREGGGNRRFIMVQLPEPTPADSPARKMGLNTIADIGKERIRRVIKRTKDNAAQKLDLSDRETPEDLGFKVFKLAESNFRPWTPPEPTDPETYIAQMELMVDPLVEGWTPQNVITEVAIKEGYGLNAVIQRLEALDTNTIYRVTDPDKEQSFFICLDDKIDPATPQALCPAKDDLFVCRDVALTDEMAANLALQCNLKTI